MRILLQLYDLYFFDLCLRLRPSCEVSAETHRKSIRTPNNRFGPSFLCEPTMASADFSMLSHRLSMIIVPLPGKLEISPGNAHSPSRLCLPHIRPCLPCKYWTSELFALLPSMSASYVISVRQASVLPSVPSDSTSRQTPLPFG